MLAANDIAIDAQEVEPTGSANRLRALMVLTLILWAINFGMGTLANVLADAANLPLLAAVRLGVHAGGLLFCAFLYAVWRQAGSSLATRIISVALLVPVAAAACTYGSVVIEQLARDQLGGPTLAELVRTLSRWGWFFLSWSGLCLAVDYYFDAREGEVRALEFRALAQHAQLKALHSQINPHFLFNSLNSVSALIGDRRIQDADRILDLLATYFRKTLTIDPATDIALIDEVDLHREYLEIEQARYQNLSVDITIPSELQHALVPALLLQPLIENAVKHGVARSSAPAAIFVRAKRDEDKLIIHVENSQMVGSAPAPAPDGMGLGLQNVRERLTRRFGDPEALSVTRAPYTFSVSLILPLRP